MISPDNPVWQALCSHQHYFNIGHHLLKYFPEEVSPFVGMEHWDEQDLQVLMNDLPAERNFSVMIAKRVQLPAELNIIFGCTLYQMEAMAAPKEIDGEHVIRKLGYTELPHMLELTGKTKPGPFFTRTIEMGDYYGIFEDGRLASMAGERLRMPGCTEISAICTDPDFLGRGYASMLTAYVARKIFAAGSRPILHVKTDNLRAIEVYRRAGFDIRTEVFFAIFRK
jgi:predicted GNAT family acetyltransferase